MKKKLYTVTLRTKQNMMADTFGETVEQTISSCELLAKVIEAADSDDLDIEFKSSKMIGDLDFATGAEEYEVIFTIECTKVDHTDFKLRVAELDLGGWILQM